MNYKKEILENGLRVLTIPMPSVESATVTVWVRTGSRFEGEKINGISHFLEHMVFKGSKKRPTAKDISETIDSIGGEFNAGTSKEWTNFYVKARAGRIETAFDVISDMVLNPLLKAEEIEREKGVIVEEIAMYEDTPMIKIGDVFEELMFHGHPLARDIAGTPDTVKGITREDFLTYRDIHYYSENVLITVAGGVKEESVLKLAKKYFGELKKGKSPVDFEKYSEDQSMPQAKLSSKKKEQAHFILGYRGNHLGHEDRYAESVLAVILGGGMSSRLFIEVRERRGLAYAVRTSTDHYLDTGYIGTYAGVDTKRVDDAIKVIIDEHTKLTKNGEISDAELTKAKEYLKGHLALSLEDTKDVNSFFGMEELLLGKVRTPQEVYDGIDKVDKDDVVRLAKSFFSPERLNLAIIGPYDDQLRFEKLLK